MEIISRKDALAKGLKRYFTGKPCKRGHISERKASDKSCCECNKLNQAKKRENKSFVEAERSRARARWAACPAIRKRKQESDKRLRSTSEFLEKQREKDKERYRLDDEYRKRKIAQVADYSKRNREKINERNRAWFKEKYRSDAQFRAAHVARSFLQRVVNAAGEKKSGSTFDILGYTRGEFVKHIERQFSKGMSWENHGEWHIDHIVPVAWHVKNGETDPKIINALSNLQPLWAKENFSKKANLLVMI